MQMQLVTFNSCFSSSVYLFLHAITLLQSPYFERATKSYILLDSIIPPLVCKSNREQSADLFSGAVGRIFTGR